MYQINDKIIYKRDVCVIRNLKKVSNMLSTTEEITKLNLTSNLLKKLNEMNIKVIQDIWELKRKDLKDLGLTDREIKSIVISLQLEGLDLNKKIYD